MKQLSTHREHGWLWCVLALGVIVQTGCEDEALRRSREMNSKASRVYLMRGIFGVFSFGIDGLEGRFKQGGYNADMILAGEISEKVEYLSFCYHTLRDDQPIVLIGHSTGGEDVLKFADELGKAGVPVDLVVAIDAVNPPRVPKNVRRCVHLYLGHGLTHAWPLKPGPGFNGVLENIDIYGDGLGFKTHGVDHFNVDDNDKLHGWIVGQVDHARQDYEGKLARARRNAGNRRAARLQF